MSGLTVRGRSLIAAGIACLVSSVALGEEDLLRVGVLLIVLPLAAAAVLAGTRLKLSCIRTLHPRRVSAGSAVRVDLRVENLSRRATPAMYAEDIVLPDGAAGLREGASASTPRFALDRLTGGDGRTLSYTLRPPRRGLYELGPLALRLCDPFGFCELPRMFSAVDRLLVTPEVVPLPRVDPIGQLAAGATSHGGRVGGTGEDDIGTRPYRLGDELRRVHWRTTARIGELSVRREEQPRQGSVTLLLDTRASAWPPGTARGLDAEPAGGGFETAVSVVASLLVALAGSGTGVTVTTLDGEALGRIPGGRWNTSAEVALLLERLASVTVGPFTVGPATVRPADAAPSRVGFHRPATPLRVTDDRVVAVLGRWRPADVELLPHSAAPGSGVALVVGGEGDLSPLTAAGWLTASVPRLSALPLVWQQVSAGSASSGQSFR